MRENIMRDSLYNMRRDSGASKDYGTGVLVGVVTALMATENINFEQAARRVAKLVPAGARDECFPEGWREHFPTK